jgi:hypothetical protein
MSTKKSINFTIVPEEPQVAEGAKRLYANFCAVSHTPFDFTLTFCEVQPLSEKDIADVPEGATKTIGAPVKAKLVIPVQLVGALAAALQENLKMYQDSYSNVGWSKAGTGGLH